MEGFKSAFCFLVISAMFISGTYGYDCVSEDSVTCPFLNTECTEQAPYSLQTYYELSNTDGARCYLCSLCAESLDVCPAVPIEKRDLWKRWRILENCPNPVFYTLWADVDGEQCFGGEAFSC